MLEPRIITSRGAAPPSREVTSEAGWPAAVVVSANVITPSGSAFTAAVTSIERVPSRVARGIVPSDGPSGGRLFQVIVDSFHNLFSTKSLRN